MVLLRGSGGSVWDIDPPEPGTARRRQFDEQLAAGELVPAVAPDPEPAPTSSPRKRAPKQPPKEA